MKERLAREARQTAAVRQPAASHGAGGAIGGRPPEGWTRAWQRGRGKIEDGLTGGFAHCSFRKRCGLWKRLRRRVLKGSMARAIEGNKVVGPPSEAWSCFKAMKLQRRWPFAAGASREGGVLFFIGSGWSRQVHCRTRRFQARPLPGGARDAAHEPNRRDKKPRGPGNS